MPPAEISDVSVKNVRRPTIGSGAERDSIFDYGRPGPGRARPDRYRDTEKDTNYCGVKNLIV